MLACLGLGMCVDAHSMWPPAAPAISRGMHPGVRQDVPADVLTCSVQPISEPSRNYLSSNSSRSATGHVLLMFSCRCHRQGARMQCAERKAACAPVSEERQLGGLVAVLNESDSLQLPSVSSSALVAARLSRYVLIVAWLRTLAGLRHSSPRLLQHTRLERLLAGIAAYLDQVAAKRCCRKNNTSLLQFVYCNARRKQHATQSGCDNTEKTC